ncbi:MAG: hypothetical protein ACUVXI_12890 [bacterium]
MNGRVISFDGSRIANAIFKLNSKTGYEFRTTVVPALRSEEDMAEICQHLKGARGYILRSFRGERPLGGSLSGARPYGAVNAL